MAKKKSFACKSPILIGGPAAGAGLGAIAGWALGRWRSAAEETYFLSPTPMWNGTIAFGTISGALAGLLLGAVGGAMIGCKR